MRKVPGTTYFIRSSPVMLISRSMTVGGRVLVVDFKTVSSMAVRGYSSASKSSGSTRSQVATDGPLLVEGVAVAAAVAAAAAAAVVCVVVVAPERDEIDDRVCLRTGEASGCDGAWECDDAFVCCC